jgi:tetratricopeptide (TPR) repeat protein
MEDKRKPEDVLEESPKEHMELGIMYYVNGKIDEAIDELKKAIRLKPDYVAAFFNLAAILSEAGRIEELEKIKKEVAEAVSLSLIRARAEESKDPKVHLELGVLFYIQGRYDEAEAELRKAIELNPDYTLAYYNLAVLLREIGRHKEAEEHFKKSEK